VSFTTINTTGVALSSIVESNVEVLENDSPLNEFSYSAMVVTDNSTIPTNTIVRFSLLEDVNRYFGIHSQESKLAKIYFNGFTGCATRPLYINYFFSNAKIEDAYIESGDQINSSQITSFQSIKDGNIVFHFDGLEQELNELDFSAATVLSDVANILQLALRNIISTSIVQYEAVSKKFIVHSGNMSGLSTVDFCDDSELAILLQLTKSTNAIISHGSVPLSPSETMDKIVSLDVNWATLITLFDSKNITDTLAYAKWINTVSNLSFVYVAYSYDETAIIRLSDELTALHYNNTALAFGDYEFAAFISTISASNRFITGHVIPSFNGNRQIGLKPTCYDTAQAKRLTNKLVNVYVSLKDINNTNCLQYGSIIGIMKQLMLAYNSIYIQNVLNQEALDLYVNNYKIEDSPESINSIETAFSAIIQQAIDIGVIIPGVKISQNQKNIILSQTSSDNIINELIQTGYLLFINFSYINELQYLVITLLYTTLLAVQKIQINTDIIIGE
jgi:hypothetical protein